MRDALANLGDRGTVLVALVSAVCVVMLIVLLHHVGRSTASTASPEITAPVVTAVGPPVPAVTTAPVVTRRQAGPMRRVRVHHPAP